MWARQQDSKLARLAREADADKLDILLGGPPSIALTAHCEHTLQRLWQQTFVPFPANFSTSCEPCVHSITAPRYMHCLQPFHPTFCALLMLFEGHAQMAHLLSAACWLQLMAQMAHDTSLTTVLDTRCR